MFEFLQEWHPFHFASALESPGKFGLLQGNLHQDLERVCDSRIRIFTLSLVNAE